jgi:hypothetical protein
MFFRSSITVQAYLEFWGPPKLWALCGRTGRTPMGPALRSCLMVVYTLVSSQVVSCLLQYPSLSLEFMGSCLACWSAAVSGSCQSVVAVSAVFVARLTM